MSFSGNEYWDEKVDETAGGDNLIFTIRGMREIAQHYREKYTIEIIPLSTFVRSAPEHIHRYLKEHPSIQRCGFIVFDGVHAHPMIWEKNRDNQSIFFLDTGAIFSRDTSSTYQFKINIKRLIPDIQLWTHVDRRQVDNTSCTIDALVMLKDGLRLDSLTRIAEQKPIDDIVDMKKNIVTHCYLLPEQLQRTAQIGTFPSKQKAKLDTPIQTGKKNKHITLGDFRAKYAVEHVIPVYEPIPAGQPSKGRFFNLDVHSQRKIIGNKTVEFGSFTITKGKKYAALIKKRWEERKLFLSRLQDMDAQLEDVLRPYSVDKRRVNPLKKAHELQLKIKQYLSDCADEYLIIDHREINAALRLSERLIKSVREYKSVQRKARLHPEISPEELVDMFVSEAEQDNRRFFGSYLGEEGASYISLLLNAITKSLLSPKESPSYQRAMEACAIFESDYSKGHFFFRENLRNILGEAAFEGDKLSSLADKLYMKAVVKLDEAKPAEAKSAETKSDHQEIMSPKKKA
jgi:hypothetical protein